MEPIDNLGAANQKMGEFVFGPSAASLPDDLGDAIRKAFNEVSPVKRVVDFTETVFANRDHFDASALAVAAELATFCSINSWHHMREERGDLVCATLRRDAGAKKPGGGKWHAADKDPDPAPGVFVMPSTDEAAADEPEAEAGTA